MNSPVICLAGKNQIAVDALLYLIARGDTERLVVCPNQTDDGRSRWQPSLVRFAEAFGVEIVTLDQAQEIEGLVFISLEFDRIVRPTAFRSKRLYNIHFSALPAYKGMYTSALPILEGAVMTGATLHEIDHGIDTGAIIAQHTFELPTSWTARDLYFKYMAHGFDLFHQSYDRLVAKDPPAATPQDSAGSTYYSKAAIDYNNLTIDLRDTAHGVMRKLRAFSFREYQTPKINDIQIGDWHVLPERSLNCRPGTVLECDDEGLVMATIDYNLRLERSRVWDWFGLEANGSTNTLDKRYVDEADKMGWTPLIRAAYAGDVPLCQILLGAGADPNKPNQNGTTPLMYAFSGRDSEAAASVAKLLLEFGADPQRTDRFKRDLQSYHPKAYAKITSDSHSLKELP